MGYFQKWRLLQKISSGIRAWIRDAGKTKKKCVCPPPPPKKNQVPYEYGWLNCFLKPLLYTHLKCHTSSVLFGHRCPGSRHLTYTCILTRDGVTKCTLFSDNWSKAAISFDAWYDTTKLPIQVGYHAKCELGTSNNYVVCICVRGGVLGLHPPPLFFLCLSLISSIYVWYVAYLPVILF